VESEISKPIFPFQRDLIREERMLHCIVELLFNVSSDDSGTSRKIFEIFEVDAFFSRSVARAQQNCKPTYFSFGGPT
jgi:hypothetical protein